MARNEAIVSIGITLEGKRAQDALKALQTSVDLTSKKVEELKKKLYEGSFDADKGETEETIKKELSRQEKDLANYKRTYDSFLKVKKGVDDVLASLSKSSYNELTRTRTLLQSSIKSLDPASEKYKQKIEQLQQLQEEIAERQRTMNNAMSKEKAAEVLAKPIDHSTDELREAIEVTRKLQSAQQIGQEDWKKYGAAISNAENLLHQYNSESKKIAMTSRLETINTASPSSLAEQKRYWQDMVRANPAIEEYKTNLQEVVNVERERMKVLAEQSMDKINEKGYSESVEDMQQRLKLLREYRNIADRGKKVIDPDTKKEVKYIDKIDQSIEALKNNIRQCEQGFMSFEDALEKVDKLNAFEGTAEDLQKLKARLEEIRDKEIKLGEKGSQENIKKINEALFKVEGKMKDVNSEAKSLDQILDNIGDSSLNDLERAAKELEAQIAKVGKNTEDYITKSARLRDVNKQIDSIKANFKEKESIIVRTGKRLASYVAIYAGFNEVVGWVKRLVNANLELSDSLADIQKTTGLTAQQVGSLSDKINSIDTRTAQKQLHELAYEAGKLGISAEEDILAFVKAGNQLVVALGEDLGGAEAVRELMKVNAILGETQNLGMERALLATGSAINEISQTSRASAGPIADVVSRIGAIGAAAKLQMPDLIALAGTADAMGQSAEVAGTAFNKFITTLQTNTVDVAYALGLDPDSLRSMLDSGQGIQAIIQIFEQMNQMGGLSDMGGIFKELGSDGARMAQVLSTMAAGVEELKAQVFTSNKAFQEATSVTNEYNIKNESAAAILERMGNNLRESFVQSGFVEWIRDVLQWLYYLPQRIEENRLALLAWNTLLVEIVMISGARFVKFLSVELAGAFKSLIITVRALAIEQAAIKWKAYTSEMWKVASVTTKLKYAFQALWVVISKHPFVAVAAAVGGVIALFKTFRNELSENVKAHAELETTIQNEQATMRKLMNDINNANSATGERAALIKELNDKYGKYLGFLVTESNYVENQAYIYDLLNAKLRESITLKMQEKRMDDIVQEHAAKKNDANRDILDSLYDIESIGQSGAPVAMENLMTAIRKQVESGGKDVNAVMNAVIGNLEESLRNSRAQIGKDYAKGKIGYDVYSKQLDEVDDQLSVIRSLRSGVKDMLDVETAISEDVKEAQVVMNANTNSMKKAAEETTKAHLDSQFSALTGKESVDQLKTLKQQTESYIKMQREGIADLVQKKTALRGLTFAEQKEYEELEKAMQSPTKPLDDQIERYNYLNQKKTVGLNLSAEEEKKIADTNAEIKRMEGNLKKVNQGLINQKAMSVWGDNEALTDKAPKELAAMYTKLEEDAARLSAASFEKVGEATAEDGKKIVTQFWKNFDTRDAAIQWYKQQKDEIAKQLKSLGYNTSGHFIGLSGNGNEKKTAHQLYRELLSELEAYYNERETAIRKNGMKQGQLESEINREIENLQIQEWNDRIELEKALLDDFYTQSSFDPSKYMGDLTKMPYFAGVKMEDVRAAIRAAGPKLVADIEKSMTGSMVKIEEKTWQIKQRIEKILLEDDFSEQVAQQYLNSLDQLGLLFNIKTEAMSDHSKEEGERRLAYMREWSKESYQLTVDDLKAKVAANDMFNSWRIGRTEQDYEALLTMLRKYNDDSIEAVKKAADRQKKIMDVKWNTVNPETGKSQADKQKENITGEEADLNMYESAERLGLASQRRVDDAQIALYQAKIEASQAYIDQITLEMSELKRKAELELSLAEAELAMNKKLGLDTEIQEAAVLSAKQKLAAIEQQTDQMTLEAKNNILEQKENIAQVELSIEERKMNRLKEYTDNIITFGEQMGEAAWGSVEDRKEAGRELLRSTLQLTKELIMDEVKRLIMKKALAAQEIATEQTKETTITTIKGEHDIARLTSEGAATTGKVALGQTAGAAKTIGELGWWGIPLIAVISAALSALMSAAMGALSKSKSEVAAATGASTGRLATGMLTYAEGNYPVLGNDGQVYNAKYEGAGMKTGIYGGGAHFGIFSEKKPEAIIDGDTTQRLILNHPDIWQSIVTLSKTGRLDRGMRTFASGNINELARTAQEADATATAQNNEQMLQMQATMAATQAAVMQLTQVLNQGIHAKIDMYGDGGMYKSMKKAESFASKRGYR